MEKILKAIKPIGQSDYRPQESCFTYGNNATRLVSFTLDGSQKLNDIVMIILIQISI